MRRTGISGLPQTAVVSWENGGNRTLQKSEQQENSGRNQNRMWCQKLWNHPVELRAVSTLGIAGSGWICRFSFGQKYGKGIASATNSRWRNLPENWWNAEKPNFWGEKAIGTNQNRINTDDLLSEEVTEQLKAEKVQLVKISSNWNDDLKNGRTAKKNTNSVKNSYSKQKIEDEKIPSAGTKRIQHAAGFLQLERHEAAEPLKPTLTEVNRLERKLNKKQPE